MAFDQIKNKIAESTFRYQPTLKEEMILTIDTSDSSIGVILSQKDVKRKRKMIHAF